MRHLGLLRSLVIPACEQVRNRLLLEILSRTLKNLLREVQREWMKSRKTTSEHGMYEVVVRFFNLLTVVHPSSNDFWTRVLPEGVAKRFGPCALTEIENQNLLQKCTGILNLKHYENYTYFFLFFCWSMHGTHPAHSV